MEGLGLSFWKGKKVLITGNTGFKGTWLSVWLAKLGAQVTGYSLPAPTNPSMFELLGMSDVVETITGDVNNLTDLKRAIKDNEIVFHLAAQPIVKESYKEPTYTLQTNIMGTANILEACRSSKVKSIVIVTTDKVYENKEWVYKYRETDTLGGHDPYSCSKACAEFIVDSYRKSFGLRVVTARAGNVIGGGDFAPYRLIPDIVRSIENKQPIVIRNPNATRPYQHVLECLYGYMLLAKAVYEDKFTHASYNFAPDESCSTMDIVNHVRIEHKYEPSNEHESCFLELDNARAKQLLGWEPIWTIKTVLNITFDWYNYYLAKDDLYSETIREITEYESSIRWKNLRRERTK